MKKYLTLFLITAPHLLATKLLSAQEAPVPMADAMRSNGKIYVVVAVMLTLLVGLFLYLIRIDRKISRLEKK